MRYAPTQGMIAESLWKKKKNKNLVNKLKRQDFYFLFFSNFTGEVQFPGKLHCNSSDYWVIKIFQAIPFSFSFQSLWRKLSTKRFFI